MMMERLLEPEWLDKLPPDDPRARRSRQDLQRLNIIMANAGILRRAIAQHSPKPSRIAELGAGDGTFMLSLAHYLDIAPTHVVLVDRQPCIAEATLQAFHDLDWTVDIIAADVFDWLATAEPVDAMVCNLFLHHLPSHALAELFKTCAANTSTFVACEPARTWLALTASRLLGLIGCNAVTRHDAVISVRAGFAGSELSGLWPDREHWQLDEHGAGVFSHLFIARCR